MKIFGVASDVHLHKWSAFSKPLPSKVNSRLQIILDELIRVAETIVKAGGDRLVITGDLFHVRGSISPSVLNPAIETFQKLHTVGINRITILAGNHDLESKDSSRLTNANVSLSSMPFVHVVSESEYEEKNNALYIPWIDNCDDLMTEIKDWLTEIVPADKHAETDLFIHAPMDDVLPNMPGHGLNPSDLKALGLNRVFCGHYHNHKEVKGNVFSVGALTHQTWGDVNSKAGFMIISGDEICHHPSSAPSFVDYDEKIDPREAPDLFKGNYVRVKLTEADPSEIAEIRDYLMNECNALDCIIQAQPKSKVVGRTTTVSKSATLRGSVGSFIDAKVMTVEKSDVLSECEDILTQTGAI